MKTKFKLNQKVWFLSLWQPINEPVKSKITGIFYGYHDIVNPQGSPYVRYFLECGGSGVDEPYLFKTKKECLI